MTYEVLSNLRLGVEMNWLANRIGPLLNWRAVSETRSRPAVMFGTSSDRIGTERGQAYFGTVAKNLKPWIGLDVSPYVGVSWNDRDEKFLELAGLQYRPLERISVTHLWDGRNLHHTLDYSFDTHSIGLIVAEQDGEHFFGLTLGVRF